MCNLDWSRVSIRAPARHIIRFFVVLSLLRGENVFEHFISFANFIPPLPATQHKQTTTKHGRHAAAADVRGRLHSRHHVPGGRDARAQDGLRRGTGLLPHRLLQEPWAQGVRVPGRHPGAGQVLLHARLQVLLLPHHVQRALEQAPVQGESGGEGPGGCARHRARDPHDLPHGSGQDWTPARQGEQVQEQLHGLRHAHLQDQGLLRLVFGLGRHAVAPVLVDRHVLCHPVLVEELCGAPHQERGGGDALANLISGFLAGCFASIPNAPGDVVRSVVQKKLFNEPDRVARGISVGGVLEHVAVAREIVAARGITALYAGFGFKAMHLGGSGALMAMFVPIFADLMGIKYSGV